MRVLAALINRAFWISICFVVLAIMFVSSFMVMTGWPLLLLSVIGIAIGFSILRLATAPLRPRQKALQKRRPAR